MFESKQLKHKLEIIDEKTNNICDTIVKERIEREELNKKIEHLSINKPNGLSIEENKRIADLEVKMSKLWTMLVEQTPTGKEKLNKFGRGFARRFID